LSLIAILQHATGNVTSAPWYKMQRRRRAATQRRRKELLPIAFDFESFAPRFHQFERGYRPEQKWHRSLLCLASEGKRPGGSEVPRRPRTWAAVAAREFPQKETKMTPMANSTAVNQYDRGKESTFSLM
jgi:hypothetical protein